MDASNHAKQERRIVTLQAIQELKEAFPLQQKLEQADTALRRTYIEVLSYWTKYGMSPAKDDALSSLLAALHAFDALVIDEHGISCYPFSARDTDIQVDYAGISVRATCAIDAFAIPRLVGHAARVTARCNDCRCHITCSIEANGSVDGGYSEGLRVIWISKSAAEVGRHGFCEEIAFICAHCEIPRKAISFTVPEAAVIGNSIFLFQKQWLAHQSS